VSDADKLRQTLTELHQELATAEVKDPAVRDMLVRTVREISQQLTADLGEPQPAADAPPAELLRAAARRFEVDHPALAQTLESLVDALARMGI